MKIDKNRETGEYVAKVYINGKYSEDKTYYTNDLQDAVDTAKHMKSEFEKMGYIVESSK